MVNAGFFASTDRESAEAVWEHCNFSQTEAHSPMDDYEKIQVIKNCFSRFKS